MGWLTTARVRSPRPTVAHGSGRLGSPAGSKNYAAGDWPITEGSILWCRPALGGRERSQVRFARAKGRATSIGLTLVGIIPAAVSNRTIVLGYPNGNRARPRVLMPPASSA